MSEPDILVEEIGAVLRVTFNRPEKLNALNKAIMQGLGDAVRLYAQRDDLRVFLITAKGRYFCAGANLGGSDMPGPLNDGSAAMRHWYRSGVMGWGMHPLYDDIEALEKPFVVAHHAPCVGGGLELSLSCDFRLAANGATYSLPEAKLGSIPASGGVSRLTRLVGQQWAKWLIMGGQTINAERALSIGLVQEVYPDDTFEADVMAFCEKLASQPPEMMAMAKLTIDLTTDLTPGRGRMVERLGQSVLGTGAEAKEAMATWRARFRTERPEQ
jgi:enoyl-CoA hydratase/carnithine racemase